MKGIVYMVFIIVLLIASTLPGQAKDEPGQKGKKKVRLPVVAGQFYPAEEARLERMVQQFFQEGKGNQVSGRIRGLIAPHAGYIYSGPIAATGYRQIDPATRTVIVLAPSHHVGAARASITDVDFYRTPLGDIPLSPIAATLAKQALFAPMPIMDQQEHSLEVQLPFLQEMLKHFELVPITIGQADPDPIAKALLPYIDDNTLIVASSDLSHYYPYEKAKILDASCTKAITSLDLGKMAVSEACGKIPIMVLMEIARQKGWQAKLIDCRNSGDTAGPRDEVVGYASIAFVSESGTEKSVEKPKGSDVEKSKGSDVEKPKGSDVEKSKGSDVEKSKGSDVEKPKGSDVEKSKGSDMVNDPGEGKATGTPQEKSKDKDRARGVIKSGVETKSSQSPASSESASPASSRHPASSESASSASSESASPASSEHPASSESASSASPASSRHPESSESASSASPASSRSPSSASSKHPESTESVSHADKKALLALARKVISNTLNDRNDRDGADSPSLLDNKGDGPLTENFSPYVREKRGCFVTLHKNGQLRGCIGTIVPEERLCDCVKENALNAAFRDPRFSPLSRKELDQVVIEISVLTMPREIHFSSAEDLKRQLRPGLDGVILSQGWHRATYLPQVWEQLPNKEDFLENLCQKASLHRNAWKDPKIKVEVYQAIVFSE
jgi:AmmeMemoRadiSam system protein B/AmmeMemoRadiSam system protein A